ncbi:hypothetical protein IQ276_039410 [Desmonostoc muscorum LEGE 12446]|uniref:Uncharacterized protein n=1 Tax=Desmonostoc muscorum LEGE 12446 TaxID=1828758 RepID=A0A8J6ZZX4_DESMC|nr:hypothetical protein [Desmonostoc muscorum]MCF2152355.1 hypothetical protein [Desmonostoc muscorum LEGE 12446]
MNSIISTEEIVIILAGVEQTLRLIQATPEYSRLQTSKHFTTSNDLVLNDAIQSISEVLDGIEKVQLANSSDED